MAEVGAMNRAERVPALCLARSRCVGLANASAAQYTWTLLGVTMGAVPANPGCSRGRCGSCVWN